MHLKQLIEELRRHGGWKELDEEAALDSGHSAVKQKDRLAAVSPKSD